MVSRSFLRSAPILAVVALIASGCMFKVNHVLPPHTYMGRAPAGDGGMKRDFDRQGMKNWALAGLVPYTRWGTGDLLRSAGAVSRIEDLEVETRFSVVDTIVWVVPGFFYGYYVWAPRTIRVKGTEVLREPSAP